MSLQMGHWGWNRGFQRNRVRLFLQRSIAVVIVVLIEAASLTAAQDLLPQSDEVLPALQPHSLPTSLVEWRSIQSDDYFSQISPTPAGYLVWSRFPIKIFIQPASEHDPIARTQEWISAVDDAVQEWHTYLPLTIVEAPEAADIVVWRRSPPLRSRVVGVTTELRARSAETRYELFVDRVSVPAILAHRCQILLRPGQTATYIRAAARHELGHALGLWGHSPSETDALYFSQVRNPALISARDINTLKRIYQQPTRLGWSVEPISEFDRP